MKKMASLLAAAVLFSGVAFAQEEENGALGLGVMSDSAENNLVGGGIRGNIFLDVGYQLTGPLYYGFEFQGAIKKMDESKSAFKQTDAKVFQIDADNWVAFVQSSSWDLTTVRWDADFSPRATLSFDLGNKIQILGFAGLNYNWTTIDTTVKNKNTGAGSYTFAGGSSWGTFNAGQEKTKSKALDGTWGVVAGFRGTVGFFYVDYTRFLTAFGSGNYSWNEFNKDRLGFGINLRF